MARSAKYGIREFHRDFPTNKACLEFIFDSVHKRKCSCGGIYSIRPKRKLFQCSKCRYQISPMVNTIFQKSSTPLLLWFHALLIFSNAKSGISAKQLERQLAVTYKCAWRILLLIRKTLRQFGKRLKGIVEVDETYIGGIRKAGKGQKYPSQAIKAKSAILGALERGGRLRASTVVHIDGDTVEDFMYGNIDKRGTRIATDKGNQFNSMGKVYDRHSVNHKQKEYVRGDIHVNGIENFWSHSKRSITGVHKAISKKHAQSYLDAFVFHYNNRHNDRRRFEMLLQIALLSAKEKETPSLS